MRWIIFLVSFCAAMILAFGLSKWCEKQINPVAVAVFMEKRVKAALEAISSIESHPEKTILIWGASEVEGTLNPFSLERAFLEKGFDTKVYNLGVRSMDMSLIRDFAAGFRDRLSPKASGKLFLTSVLKLPLARMTKTYSKQSLLVDRVRIEAASHSWLGVRQIAKESTEDAFSLVVEKTFWNFGSPRYFFIWLQMIPLTLDFLMQRSQDASSEINSIWIHSSLLEKPEWKLEKRGFYGFNRDIDGATYNRLVREKWTQPLRGRAVSYYETRYDLVGLNFDPLRVVEMYEAIRVLQSISQNVVLVTPPEASDLRDRRGSDSLARLAALKAEIRETTGIEVLDWDDQLKDFGDEKYVDAEHLNESGWEWTFPKIVGRIKDQHDSKR